MIEIPYLVAGALALGVLRCAPAAAGVLDTVKQRGTLNCGTDNTGTPHWQSP